jgi:hypothetical protein
MKKLIFLLLAVLLVCPIKAQEEEDEIQTLFGGEEIHVSGFGGPIMNFSMLDGKFAHMMGGGGGVLINNFFFGGYGVGLTNSIDYQGTYNELGFGHGGFWLGYNFMARKVIHPSLHLQIGWGKISEKLPTGGPAFGEDNIFVTIPTLELEMNITKYFKISAGANYRFVFFVDEEDFTESDFMSPGVFLGFKFGWF